MAIQGHLFGYVRRVLMLLMTCVAACACTQAFAQGNSVRLNGPGTLVEYKTMTSAFLSSTPAVIIWLPPGYRSDVRRYDVLYMNDGQNLFESATAFGGHAWRVDKAVAKLMADGAIRPTIVVGIANMGAARARQYTPQGVFDRLPPAVKHYYQGMGLQGAPFSDNFLRFLVKELKPFIDRTYRTYPNRQSTFIMGSSMGALISLYAIAEYPDVFGGAGCMSPHWPLVLPSKSGMPMAAGRPIFERPVTDAFTAYLRKRLGPPDNRRLWFDHGTKSLDASYGPYQQGINRALRSLGWRQGIDFKSKVYVGATHNETAWRARLADPLTFLLAANGPNSDGSPGALPVQSLNRH